MVTSKERMMSHGYEDKAECGEQKKEGFKEKTKMMGRSTSMKIRKADIAFAISPDHPWDLGNEVLYRLCKEHPHHKIDQEIIAKIWLIGRSYAAAIERRKTKKKGESSDGFYEQHVVRAIRSSGIDGWLKTLPRPSKAGLTDSDLFQVLKTHKQVTELFTRLTGLEKRSLASKYLHFHRPDLFFIYDSRARRGIYAVTPRRMPKIRYKAKSVDREYHAFLIKCLWLRDEIRRRYRQLLTPRQLDKVLLRVCERLS